jgi:hypothetical protein
MITAFITFVSENLLIIQVVSLLISTIFLFLIIFFLIKTDIIGERVEHYIGVLGSKDISKRRSLKAWKQIQKKLRMKESNQWKLAILEADKILDEILRMAGFPGRNLDERLEQADPAQIPNLEELRQAHKTRDRIANEPAFIVTQNEVGIIIEIYRKTFQDLNLIE